MIGAVLVSMRTVLRSPERPGRLAMSSTWLQRRRRSDSYFVPRNAHMVAVTQPRLNAKRVFGMTGALTQL